MKPLLSLLPKLQSREASVAAVAEVPHAGDGSGDVSESELTRLERLFRDRLVNGILYQSKLEWQDFDIEAFLKLIEASDLETVCRKSSFGHSDQPALSPAELRDADQRKKKRDRERKGAYERLMCEMRLLAEVLKVLDAPAEDIKVSGLIGVIKDAKRNPDIKFDSRVYKRKPGGPVKYTYPFVLRDNRDLVFTPGEGLSSWTAKGAGIENADAGGPRREVSASSGEGLDAFSFDADDEFEIPDAGGVAKIRLMGDRVR